MSPSSRDVGANVSRTKIASDFASDRKLGSGYQKSAPTTVSFNADAIDDDSALLALGKQFEEIADEIRNLRRLEPVEAAIMAAPAHTFAGLGVKARLAAYVMSEYWNGPIDRIDWDARAVRLLIEAVCKSAGTPLPFHGAPNPE
jgi:hypothetical protein